MKFVEAYEALKQGAMIRCPEWAGYWKWENDSIKMYCKDGRVLDIRELENIDYTVNFILRDDWEIVGKAEVCDLNIRTFTFGEAIRRLKSGKKVARKGWNGKGMFIYMQEGSSVDFYDLKPELQEKLENSACVSGRDGLVHICPHIDMKAADGSLVIGWLASQTDMLAEDWVEVV